MSDTIEIFLGKNGQTFGPYTVTQFEEIKASADYATYTFIWDGRDAQPDWKSLDQAPAAPKAPTRRGPTAPPPDITTPTATPSRAAIPTRPVLRGYDVPGLEALCHDSRTVIAGKLTQVTDAGCELVCAKQAIAPGFGSQSPVVLNLLDPQTGRAMNVPARLNGVTRQNGNWSLKVVWDGCPALVVQQLESAA